MCASKTAATQKSKPKSQTAQTHCSRPALIGLQDVKVVEGPKLAPITEIRSFRGRFCEQAVNGETIEAQGKVELVTNKKTGGESYRLILGNKPSDYMVLSH